MARFRSIYRKRPAGSGDPGICLVCTAARRAERNPAIDAAVAFSLSAEVELQGLVPREFLDRVVSRLLALTENEALTLIRAVPREAYASDEFDDSCLLAGACSFHALLSSHVAA